MVSLNGKLIRGKSVNRKVQGNIVKVGEMTRSGNFFMEKDERKGHFKYKDKGFGMNEDVFQKIKDRADQIVVVFTDNHGQQAMYKADPETWEEHGTVKKDGAEKQRFLSLDHQDKTPVGDN